MSPHGPGRTGSVIASSLDTGCPLGAEITPENLHELGLAKGCRHGEARL